MDSNARHCACAAVQLAMRRSKFDGRRAILPRNHDHKVPFSMPKGGPTSHIYFSQRLRLHYVAWGDRDAPPLLLVHGGRDHCRNWDWVAEDLRATITSSRRTCAVTAIRNGSRAAATRSSTTSTTSPSCSIKPR